MEKNLNMSPTGPCENMEKHFHLCTLKWNPDSPWGMQGFSTLMLHSVKYRIADVVCRGFPLSSSLLLLFHSF